MARGPFPLDPPPGFRGFNPHAPVRIYRRNLPHWRQDGATYFVTFRLADALPARCLRELARVRKQWELEHPEPRTDVDWRDFARKMTRREERWLDRGHGKCWLARGEFGRLMENALRKFANERFHLGAYVVMPNHVHVVVRPFEGQEELDAITKSWKGFTARKINQATGRSGALWQDESYDTIVRDTEHLYRIVRYIGNNPGKAGLQSKCPLWICDEWAAAGFDFSKPES